MRQAADGEQALAELHAGGIDVVLMDGQMPILDGYQATRLWREHERRLGNHPVAVVAVTANTLPADVRLAFDSGMDAHLAKPVGAQELLHAVLQAWHRNRAPRAPVDRAP